MRRSASQRRNGGAAADASADENAGEWAEGDLQAMKELLALDEFDTDIETVYEAAKKFAVDPDDLKARLAF